MAERYSISNRKTDGKPKSHVPSGKQAKERLYSSSELSKNSIITIAAVTLVVTNILTLAITSLIYRAQINHLNQEIKSLKAQIELYKKNYGEISDKNNSANQKDAPRTGITVPNNTQKSIQDALNRYIASGGKDQAALQAILAGNPNQNVTFAIAGSSTTKQTLAQAIASLSYLNGASGTWNWNVSQTQISQFQAGQYAQYFGDNTVVGISSNGYVASFTVDSSGNVTQIFVSSTVSALSAGAEGSE